jgi:hypothetical protein
METPLQKMRTTGNFCALVGFGLLECTVYNGIVGCGAVVSYGICVPQFSLVDRINRLYRSIQFLRTGGEHSNVTIHKIPIPNFHLISSPFRNFETVRIDFSRWGTRFFPRPRPIFLSSLTQNRRKLDGLSHVVKYISCRSP